MFSDINAIVVGRNGRVDILKAMFGSSNPPPGKPQPRSHSTTTTVEKPKAAITPALFDRMFAGKQKPKRSVSKRAR